ncbi:MAG: M20/M25/M40 family metallo-hydrolase [Firmicutes bacterium]|nr:M20/M25/M40 family metallo-hydrolase [Bacillota bacterium]
MKYVLYILLGAVAVCLLLVLIALLKTLLSPQKKSEWKPARDEAREAEYAKKLSRMVQCETVSYKGPQDREKFLEFHKVLEELFPKLHAALEKTEIDGNLLYYWKGKSSEKPIVLMAHQDVVPAEGEWEHAPFSGDIADGKIWGRGSADDKSALIAEMQAVEELVSEGFVPDQDVYISSSCTEENSGGGCPKLVDELKRRGVRPWLVCDEGGAIVEAPIGGMSGHFAMMGVLEKGHGNLLIKAKSNGGHSSYPPLNSPIARLAKFETEIEKHNPMKKEFGPEVKAMFGTLAPYAPFAYRLLLGNLWLFSPLLKAVLPSMSPQVAALMRTTTAFTMQSGSQAENALPQEATLNINLRYIPHQGRDASNDAIRKVAAKYGLEVEEKPCEEYCEPVDFNGEAYKLVESVAHEVFPGLPTVPYVMTGGTDARYYQEICDACVRFAPIVYGPAQMKGMHGLNENLDCFSLPGGVDFYKTVIRRNK